MGRRAGCENTTRSIIAANMDLELWQVLRFNGAYSYTTFDSNSLRQASNVVAASFWVWGMMVAEPKWGQISKVMVLLGGGGGSEK